MRVRRGVDLLNYEIVQEQASTLGVGGVAWRRR
jgi:hypothetical protein